MERYDRFLVAVSPKTPKKDIEHACVEIWGRRGPTCKEYEGFGTAILVGALRYCRANASQFVSCKKTSGSVFKAIEGIVGAHVSSWSGGPPLKGNSFSEDACQNATQTFQPRTQRRLSLRQYMGRPFSTMPHTSQGWHVPLTCCRQVSHT